MSTQPNAFALGLDRNAANFASLTPLTFLAWSADAYPDLRPWSTAAAGSPGARCTNGAAGWRPRFSEPASIAATPSP